MGKPQYTAHAGGGAQNQVLTGQCGLTEGARGITEVEAGYGATAAQRTDQRGMGALAPKGECRRRPGGEINGAGTAIETHRRGREGPQDVDDDDSVKVLRLVPKTVKGNDIDFHGAQRYRNLLPRAICPAKSGVRPEFLQVPAGALRWLECWPANGEWRLHSGR